MAHELATEIYNLAITISESENTSYIKIKIDGVHLLEFDLIKTKDYVLINNYKIAISKNFNKIIKQLWKYILTDKIYVYCHDNNLPLTHRIFSVGWYKNKTSSLLLFENDVDDKNIIVSDKIIDFLSFVSNPDLSVL
jgi:hypothetical protein